MLKQFNGQMAETNSPSIVKAINHPGPSGPFKYPHSVQKLIDLLFPKSLPCATSEGISSGQKPLHKE
ncbi:MAG TPA: hypothetical protein VE978_04135 [Chitinophagales bacterium]|nr:hypothetical protein [Chitinophagales bacterium]